MLQQSRVQSLCFPGIVGTKTKCKGVPKAQKFLLNLIRLQEKIKKVISKKKHKKNISKEMAQKISFCTHIL
jgi:hypothetical protein